MKPALLFLSFCLCLPPLRAAEPSEGAPGRAWTDAAVETFRHLPVQDGGRVKPLDTVASFQLLRLNGKRSCRDLDGEKLKPIEWMMDCLFFPDMARQYKVFLVRTNEVLFAIELDIPDRKKSDRYSYAELSPGIPKLFEAARNYAHIEPKDRSPVESQLVTLAENIVQYENIAHYLDGIREQYPLRTHEALAQIYAAIEGDGMSAMLEGLPEVYQLWVRSQQDPGSSPTEGSGEAVQNLLERASRRTQWAHGLALFPPAGSTEKLPVWHTLADVFELRLLGDPTSMKTLEWVSGLEQLDRVKQDPPAFEAELNRLQADIQAVAESLGQYDKIPMEVTFYKLDFFYVSLYFFVAAFLLIAVTWMRDHRWIHRAAVSAMLAGTLVLSAGITYRCILRDRPPVSTLYETILFITAVGVIAALVIELLNRRRIALVIAAVLGSGGLFLANRYEMKEAVDTMPQLMAVLDTNFWLSTHVTTVTMGYAAGLLAAAIAHIFLLGKFFGFKREDPAFYKNITRMTYGAICFGLLFSTVGTILGGIWANDSWGRFWGWDPKENGALMIVLWQLFMLHGRMGGYLRDFGLNLAAVFGGIVVAFSWWGVNLLGVGLHSYGFTNGIQRNLYIFYAAEVLVMVLGALAYYMGTRSSTGASGGAATKEGT